MSLLNPVRETPFYRTTWFVVIALFLFWPAGLVLMWTSEDWEKRTRIIVTAVVAALTVGWWFAR
jgi:hypothetical protein